MKKMSSHSLPTKYITVSLIIVAVAVLFNAIYYAAAAPDSQLAIMGTVAQYLLLLAPLYVAPTVFFWLRISGKRSSGSEVTSTLITASSLTISSIIAQIWLMPLLTGQVRLDIGAIAWLAVLDFVMAFLFSLLASSIAKKIYLSKHSIVV